MSEDAAQGAATAAEGTVSAAEAAALNPVFRTAPAADTGGQQGTATQKPAGRQQAAQGRTAARGGDRSPEELLADAHPTAGRHRGPPRQGQRRARQMEAAVPRQRETRQAQRREGEELRRVRGIPEDRAAATGRPARRGAAGSAGRPGGPVPPPRRRPVRPPPRPDRPPGRRDGRRDHRTGRGVRAGDQRTRRGPRRSPGPGRRAGTAPQRQRRRVPARRVPPPRRAPRQRQQAGSEPQRVVPGHARQLEAPVSTTPARNGPGQHEARNGPEQPPNPDPRRLC